jgi:phospholipid transport system substrate-binding protein
MRRLLLIPALLLAFFFAPASAEADLSGLPPAAPFIQSLGDDAISIIADKSLSDNARNNKFRNMLRNSFDLQTIGRFVIGRNWNNATPAQQSEYTKLFEDLVIQTYSSRFALYTGERFLVKDARPEGEKDYIVNADILRKDGSPAASVDWRVRNKGGKLGIIDVVVEGVSMSVTQRQEYSAVLQRNGGDIDALLKVMREKLVEGEKTVVRAE